MTTIKTTAKTMTTDMALLLAIHKASSALLEAFDTAKSAGRDDIAAHVRDAQTMLNKTLRQLAVEAGQLKDTGS